MSRYPKLKTILPAHCVGTMLNNMQCAIVRYGDVVHIMHLDLARWALCTGETTSARAGQPALNTSTLRLAVISRLLSIFATEAAV